MWCFVPTELFMSVFPSRESHEHLKWENQNFPFNLNFWIIKNLPTKLAS